MLLLSVCFDGTETGQVNNSLTDNLQFLVRVQAEAALFLKKKTNKPKKILQIHIPISMFHFIFFFFFFHVSHTVALSVELIIPSVK